MQIRTIVVTSSSSSAVYTARSPLSDFAWLVLVTARVLKNQCATVHIRSETAQFVHYVTLMRSAKPRLAHRSNFHVSQSGNQTSLHGLDVLF